MAELEKARTVHKSIAQNTLSGQLAKKRPDKNIRNVLALPFDTYWPVLRSEDALLLGNQLQSCLPNVKKTVHKVPWAELKRLSKEERREKRMQAEKLEDMNDEARAAYLLSKDIRSLLIVGVNAVTRALEKSQVCCCLLAEDVNQRQLTRHIITMASHKQIPVLIVPELRNIVSKFLGFQSVALAFKDKVLQSESSQLFSVMKIIQNLANKFPCPQPYSYASVSESYDECSSDDSSNDTENRVCTATRSEPGSKSVNGSVYLYRDSKKSRVFRPSGAKTASMEFISLADAETKTQDNAKEKSDRIALVDCESSGSDMDTDELEEIFTIDTKPSKKIEQFFTNHKYQIDNKNKLKLSKKQVGAKMLNVKYFPVKVKKIQGNPKKIARKQKKKENKKKLGLVNSSQ